MREQERIGVRDVQRKTKTILEIWREALRQRATEDDPP